ncbi:hypothetical protein [Streptomyces sp. NBC_00690]|uniref:hypothetical protein n=1 Tax=Streptomyces sp. NBC_00690 TaxID=2975808 RepID=UPI002E27E821|nr:hypothetical protein [Streptomyces sp. NBC_00690]
MATHDPAGETDRPSAPEAVGYYAGAAEIARHLADAGLTPPSRSGPTGWQGEFCTVEALPADQWPPGVLWTVEVVHHPDTAYRWRLGQSDPPGAAAHRTERLMAVADTLTHLGYAVNVVDRQGWRPGQQALRVHRTDPPPHPIPPSARPTAITRLHIVTDHHHDTPPH